MNVVLWIIQALLAAAFLGAATAKLTQTREALEPKMAWVADFSARAIKAIAVAEVLGALGLLLPGILGIAGVLTPLAALGLGLLMIGALITHARRRETPFMVVNSVLLTLAAIVVWGRFGPYAF